METERGKGRKKTPTRTKNGIFALSKIKHGPNGALNGPKRLKVVFLYNCLFAEHALSEKIILNETSLGGSPTISGTLQHCCIVSKARVDFNILPS